MQFESSDSPHKRERSKSPSYASVAAGSAQPDGDFWHPEEQTFVSNIEVQPGRETQHLVRSSSGENLRVDLEVQHVSEKSKVRKTPLKEEVGTGKSGSKTKGRFDSKKSKENQGAQLTGEKQSQHHSIVISVSEKAKTIEKGSDRKSHSKEMTVGENVRGDETDIPSLVVENKDIQHPSVHPVQTIGIHDRSHPTSSTYPSEVVLPEPVIHKKGQSLDELTITHTTISPSSVDITSRTTSQQIGQLDGRVGKNTQLPQNVEIVKESAYYEVGDTSSSTVYVDDAMSGESKDGDVVISLSSQRRRKRYIGQFGEKF
ncbi:hypothetical protein GE061_013859 [Apolygus lucorum]|uniref:Uncharacterized protein n=1 Tax=Apolygus lucorum TaxID=248454 RepID=A0A8S9XQ77_APOLU|nr:hypothetical protein GE061_013859 [Apolygus lucorum]